MGVEGHIYVVTNLINGKKYVGQTVRGIDRRWKRHLADAKHQAYHSRLHRAINKYGVDNFTICIQSTCHGRKAMDMAEKYYIYLLGTQDPV